MYYLCILKGKGRQGNFDMLLLSRLIFEAQVWHLAQSLLHLVLKPFSESLHAGDIFSVILIELLLGPVLEFLIKPSLVESRIKLELHRVILRSYNLKVPFYVLVLFYLFDEIEEINHEKTHENQETGTEESTDLSFMDFIVR